ncbi:MAG: hypothetical protein V1859_09585 [archaeon]
MISKLKNSLLSGTVFIILNTLVTSGLGFVFWMFATKNYSSGQIGVVNVLTSAMNLIFVLSSFGFYNAIIRFLPKAKQNSGKLLGICLSVSAISALFLSIAFNIYSFIFFKNKLLYGGFFYIVFSLICIIWTLYNFCEPVLLSKKKIYMFFIANLIYSLSKIILLLLLKSFGETGLFISFSAPSLIPLIISYIAAKENIILNLDKNEFKHVIGFAKKTYISDIFYNLPGFLLPIIIASILSPSDSAYFYFAYMISAIIFVVPKAIAKSLFNEGSHDDNAIAKHLKTSLFVSLAVSLLMILSVHLFGTFVFMLLGKEYMANSAILLKILVFATIPISINELFITLNQIEYNLDKVIILNISTASIIIVLSIVLANFLNTTGICISIVIGHTIPSLFLIKNTLKYTSKKKQK